MTSCQEHSRDTKKGGHGRSKRAKKRNNGNRWNKKGTGDQIMAKKRKIGTGVTYNGKG